MHLARICIYACLAASLSCSALADQKLGQASQLDKAFDEALEQFSVPGGAIGLWTPDGVWVRTSGLADVASQIPVMRRDRFAIRSITKSFVVTLLLQLVAQSGGSLGLDDPIAKYLHGIPNGHKITLRELANMTSGLFDYTRSAGFVEAFQADPTRPWTTDELLGFAFNDPSHPPTNFEPGAQYQYSNTNTLVLGKLIEALTGQAFSGVLTDRILMPLELDSTVYLTGVKLPRPAVRGYQGVTDDGQPDVAVVNASALGFAGATATNLHDLARWGRALAIGSLLPSNLQQERFEANPTAADPNSPVYDAYGLGMGQVAGWWGHTGEGVGFEAAVFHNIDRNETFAVLLNASNAHDVPVRIFCRVLDVLHQAPPLTSGSVCAPGSQHFARQDMAAMSPE
jgi:D-alanyl-D-alanine carboxypeptidase